MAGQALRRLMAEYKRKYHLTRKKFVIKILILNYLFLELTLNSPEGIVAGPISEENFFEWEALISGPADTVFEGKPLN